MFTCKQLLYNREEKRFPTSIVTDNTSSVHCESPKDRASFGYTSFQSMSTAKLNTQIFMIIVSIWWDQLDIAFHDMLAQTETIPGNIYQTRLLRCRHALNDERFQTSTGKLQGFRTMKMLSPRFKKWSRLNLNLSDGEVYPIYIIFHTLLGRTITCFDPWGMTWRTTIFNPMKNSITRSIRRWYQNMTRSLTHDSYTARMMGQTNANNRR